MIQSGTIVPHGPLSGRHIVFVSGRDAPRGEIYVMRTDGLNVRRLTRNRSLDFCPTWSPDGRHIAFTSGRDGNFEIYIIRADGRAEQNLTRHDADDWYPSWSPISDSITFGSDRDGLHDVYVIDLDGDNVENLTRHAESDDDPDWSRAVLSVSPAGKQFLVWGRLKSEDHNVLPTIANPATTD